MKIAIVHNWPGMQNAELDIIKRISTAVNTLGHQLQLICPFGHPLNSEGEHIGQSTFDSLRDYDFCLHLHYVNPNFFDTFSYAVNWNPIDYILRNPDSGKDLSAKDILYRTACLQSHDALLSAGSKEMDNFADSLNMMDGMQILLNKIYLHASSLLADHLNFPNLKEFKVFYIAANWKRHGNEKNHKRLINQLDRTGLFEFYGVINRKSVNVWKGVKNYKGELPFDGGMSILEKSNQCGVSLVLNSAAHKKSGLASSRIFQACSAKTISICDSNPFILEHFGDSVLTFEYSKNCDDNFNQIMKKVEWIQKHPDEAMEKAQKAYSIFKEKFSLEKEISDLFSCHAKNVKMYMNAFCAKDVNSQVDIVYICSDEPSSIFTNFLDDVRSQIGVKTRVIIFVKPEKYDSIKSILSPLSIPYKIIKYKADLDGTYPLDGKLVSCFLEDHAKSRWFALYSHNCRWKCFHLSQLIRIMGEDDSVAMSGTFVKNNAFIKLPHDYYVYSMQSINGYLYNINVFDILQFNARKISPASLLFLTDAYQDKKMINAINFFDKGWAFFLIVWNYINKLKFPILVPKLTTIFQRNDNKWEIDAYIGSRQTIDFERSLGFAFLKNHPRFCEPLPMSIHMDGYLNKTVCKKSLLNIIFRFLFRITLTLLNIISKKESATKTHNKF